MGNMFFLFFSSDSSQSMVSVIVFRMRLVMLCVEWYAYKDSGYVACVLFVSRHSLIMLCCLQLAVVIARLGRRRLCMARTVQSMRTCLAKQHCSFGASRASHDSDVADTGNY